MFGNLLKGMEKVARYSIAEFVGFIKGKEVHEYFYYNVRYILFLFKRNKNKNVISPQPIRGMGHSAHFWD